MKFLTSQPTDNQASKVPRRLNQSRTIAKHACKQCGEELLYKNLRRHEQRKHSELFPKHLKISNHEDTFMNDLSTASTLSTTNIGNFPECSKALEQDQIYIKLEDHSAEVKKAQYIHSAFWNHFRAGDVKLRQKKASYKTFDIKTIIKPFQDAQLFFEGDVYFNWLQYNLQKQFTQKYGFYNPCSAGDEFHYHDMPLDLKWKHYVDLAYMMESFSEVYLLNKQRKEKIKKCLMIKDVRWEVTKLNNQMFQNYYMKRLRRYIIQYLHSAVDEDNLLLMRRIFEDLGPLYKPKLNIWDFLGIQRMKVLNFKGDLKWDHGKYSFLSDRYSSKRVASEFFFKEFEKLLFQCKEAFESSERFIIKFVTYQYEPQTSRMNLTLALLNKLQFEIKNINAPSWPIIKVYKSLKIVELAHIYFHYLAKSIDYPILVYQGAQKQLELMYSCDKHIYEKVVKSAEEEYNNKSELKKYVEKKFNIPDSYPYNCKSTNIYLVIEPQCALHQGRDCFWFYDCKCFAHRRARLIDYNLNLKYS